MLHKEQALVALVAGTLDLAGRQAAGQDAHKLAGSLGTFGLEEGSRLAGEIEEFWLSEKDEPNDVWALAMAVAALRKTVEAHRPTSASAGAASAGAGAAGAASVAEAMDILLVDDDDVFARYVLEPLRRRYRVAWVSSGESALAAVAKSAGPKLVLLDIEMPGMNGLTVLEQLAEQGLPDRCAIVMLTRRSLAEDIVRARKLGAFDFLAKPISVTTLTERVNRALEAVA